MSNRLDREQLAWAAGFFDGEGTVGYTECFQKSRGKRYPRIYLSVSQVHPEPLYRFIAALGFGKVTGPYKQKNPNGKHYYKVDFASLEKVQAAIGMLWTFMSTPKQIDYIRALTSYMRNYQTS